MIEVQNSRGALILLNLKSTWACHELQRMSKLLAVTLCVMPEASRQSGLLQKQPMFDTFVPLDMKVVG